MESLPPHVRVVPAAQERAPAGETAQRLERATGKPGQRAPLEFEAEIS